MPDSEPLHETLDSLREQVERDFGRAEASAGDPNSTTSAGSTSALPRLRDAEASEVTHGEPVRTSGDRRGIRFVQGNTQNNRAQLLIWAVAVPFVRGMRTKELSRLLVQQCHFEHPTTRKVGEYAPLLGGMPGRGRSADLRKSSVKLFELLL
eukprot:2365233-Amphidinium_carterae.1